MPLDTTIQIKSALIVSFFGAVFPAFGLFYLTKKVKESLYVLTICILIILTIAIPIICALICGYPEVHYNKIDIFH